MKKLVSKVKTFLKSEKGDFGVKEIAIMVAIIIIVGFVVVAVESRMGGWIDTIWDMAIDAIGNNVK